MSLDAARIVSLIGLLVGCEKVTSPAPPAPVPPPSLKIRYAAETDPSAAGTNDNYFLIDEDQVLFVLADTDGATGSPDASRRMAEGLAQRFDDPCPAAMGNVAQTDELHLTCALDATAATLVADRVGTASTAVAIVRHRRVLVADLGDVAIVSVHDGRASVVRPEASLGGAAATPRTFWIAVAPNQTLALVNKDLVAAIGLPGIQRWAAGPFNDKDAVGAAVKAMLADAQRVPDHGPLTVVLMHFVQK